MEKLDSKSSTCSLLAGSHYRLVYIGIYWVKLETYQGQLEGLHHRLRGNFHAIEQRLPRLSDRNDKLGIIDNAQKAVHTGHEFRQADVDIFLGITELSSAAV